LGGNAGRLPPPVLPTINNDFIIMPEWLTSLNFEELGVWALAIIGSASAIAKSLEQIVKLTKTERDDAILAKINRFLDKTGKFIGKLGLNPKEQKQ
jgi:hypothetical protein